MKKNILFLILVNLLYSSDTTFKVVPGMSLSMKESISNKVFNCKYLPQQMAMDYRLKEVWSEKWWIQGIKGSVKRYSVEPQKSFSQLIIKVDENTDLTDKTIVLKNKNTKTGQV